MYSGSPGVVPDGEHGAGREDLDEVRAAREQLAHAPAHRGLVVGDAAAHLVRHLDAHGQAGDFAGAVGDRDVGAGHEHARTLDQPGIDGVAKRDVDQRAIRADVPHRRESGGKRRARVRGAEQRVARGGARQRRRDVGGADVADQVRVQVDEARHDGVRRPVDQPAAAARTRAPGRDGSDAAVVDADRLVEEIPPLFHVEQLAGTDDDHLGGCGLGECGECDRRGRCEPPPIDFHAAPPNRRLCDIIRPPSKRVATCA